MATNRQRLRVTFSHGFSIWLRFWMDKALCKDAEETQRRAKETSGNKSREWLTLMGMTHLIWGNWVLWVKFWVLLLVAVELEPFPREQCRTMCILEDEKNISKRTLLKLVIFQLTSLTFLLVCISETQMEARPEHLNLYTNVCVCLFFTRLLIK